MTTINSISVNNNKDFDDEDDVDIWSPSRIADAIFNDLMENGYDDISKSNKYIIQIIKKFRYIRIKLEEIHFEISFKDLNNDTLDQITGYTIDCETAEDKYARLGWHYCRSNSTHIKTSRTCHLIIIYWWIKTIMGQSCSQWGSRGYFL